MLAAQTYRTALIAAKLTAKTVITRIFLVLTFTHFFPSRIIVLQCKNFFSPFPIFMGTSFTRISFSKFLQPPSSPFIKGDLVAACCVIIGLYLFPLFLRGVEGDY